MQQIQFTDRFGMDVRMGRPPKVVVLEDDDSLREHVLLPALRSQGWDAIGVATVAELHGAIVSFDADLAVLDVRLPDGDGTEVARAMRTLVPDIGVVMLSGETAMSIQTYALDVGADAYLTKPASMKLLCATLDGVWRRIGLSTPRAAWHLDHARGCLITPGGESIELTPTEHRVLACLARQSGRLVPREELSQLMCDRGETNVHRVHSMLHRFRAKIASRSEHAFPLSSVHGRGYILDMDGT